MGVLGGINSEFTSAVSQSHHRPISSNCQDCLGQVWLAWASLAVDYWQASAGVSAHTHTHTRQMESTRTLLSVG